MQNTLYVRTYQNIRAETELCIRIMQQDAHTHSTFLHRIHLNTRIHIQTHIRYTNTLHALETHKAASHALSLS